MLCHIRLRPGPDCPAHSIVKLTARTIAPVYLTSEMQGERYIRDVTPSVDTMKAQRRLHNGKGLPPPKDVFEKSYRRRKPGENGSAGFKKHPCGISSHIFCFATLVTHDLFSTDIEDRFINKTTSYIDLGWLYGAYQSYSVEPQ